MSLQVHFTLTPSKYVPTNPSIPLDKLDPRLHPSSAPPLNLFPASISTHKRQCRSSTPTRSLSPPRPHRRQRCSSRSPGHSPSSSHRLPCSSNFPPDSSLLGTDMPSDHNIPLSPCLSRRNLRLSGCSSPSLDNCMPNLGAPTNSIASAPPKYLLNRNVVTVFDLWREWSVGIGNGPPVSKLNETYGSGWRAGWPTKERQYYSQRLAIIDLIYRRAGGLGADGQPLKSYEEVAKQLDVEREKLGLNGLANKIKKAGR